MELARHTRQVDMIPSRFGTAPDAHLASVQWVVAGPQVGVNRLLPW